MIRSHALSFEHPSPFEGKWKVQDTKGNPFEITLSEDGLANGSRSGEGLSGTWKAEGDSAVITWQSGWTTKITKQGDQFKKTAFDKGKAEGPATDAKKVGIARVSAMGAVSPA